MSFTFEEVAARILQSDPGEVQDPDGETLEIDIEEELERPRFYFVRKARSIKSISWTL